MDTRDSTVVKSLFNTQRAKSRVGDTCQLSSDHATPWGTPVGAEGKAAVDAMLAPKVPSRQHNHAQNAESYDAGQGAYQVPTPSVTHNHAQNAETVDDARVERLTMATSKINDGSLAFGVDEVAKAGESAQRDVKASQTKLKMPEGTSRINQGHDIFGEAVPAFKHAPPPATEDFVDRPRPPGAIKTPWPGYTDAGKNQSGTRPW